MKTRHYLEKSYINIILTLCNLISIKYKRAGLKKRDNTTLRVAASRSHCLNLCGDYETDIGRLFDDGILTQCPSTDHNYLNITNKTSSLRISHPGNFSISTKVFQILVYSVNRCVYLVHPG